MKGSRSSIVVRTRLSDPIRDNVVRYVASASAGRSRSFTGSGLPYANACMAMDLTPNSGVAAVGADGWVEVRLPAAPNAYMIGLGTVQIEPTLYLRYVHADTGDTRTISVPIDGVRSTPFRSLTYAPNRAGPLFYDATYDPIPSSQEAFLLTRAYPSCGQGQIH